MKISFKNVIALAIFGVLLAGNTAFGHSILSNELQDKIKNAIVLHVDNSKTYVNNTETIVDISNVEASPFIKDGRALVPVRFIAEGFGAEVEWVDSEKKVNIILDDEVISFVIGSNQMVRKGFEYPINQKINLDVPAQIVNGRTFIPLRALAESLGKEVFWDDRGLIVISDTENLFNTASDKKLIDELEYVYRKSFAMNMTGKINNNLNIHMKLDFKGDKITGSYYYDKYKTDINLDGERTIDNSIYLREYDSKGNITGAFKGILVTKNRIDGIWTSHDMKTQMPFTVKTSNEVTNTHPQWAGEWMRLGSTQFDYSEIILKDVTASNLKLSLDAHSGANVGNIEDDTAYIGDDLAVFKNSNFIMVLSLIDDTLIVQTDGEGYFGMGVYADGDYKKGIQQKILTLTDREIFINDSYEQQFKDVVGDEYERFSNVFGSINEGEDIDNFGAKVCYGWLRGSAMYDAGIIMYTNEGKYWAAVIDVGSIKYYTNTADKTKLPKTIEEWKKGDEMPVIYMSK